MKLDKTNLSYIEPHRVILKDITLLSLNYSHDVYVFLKFLYYILDLTYYVKRGMSKMSFVWHFAHFN